jgi:hypothetical protein
MTRSSPPPRRFYEVISSQQLDTHGVDSTSSLSQEKKTERKFYFPDQREKPTIFLGAYDNLLERETLTEMQRITHNGVFLGRVYKSYLFYLKRERERERGLPRREILLWSPPPRVGLDKNSCTSHRDHRHRHKGKEKKNSTDYSITITRQEERQKRKFNILSFPFFLLQIFTTLQA